LPSAGFELTTLVVIIAQVVVNPTTHDYNGTHDYLLVTYL